MTTFLNDLISHTQVLADAMRAEMEPPPLVVDLYSQNALTDIVKLKNAGVAGVVHKAAQGSTYTDPAYNARRSLVLSAGLLWGAYLFCDDSDPIVQTDHFLAVAAPDANTLLALDVERNLPQFGSTVRLATAERIAQRIHDKVGRWPKFYSSASFANGLGIPASSVLHHCDLWIASYTKEPHPTLPSGWTTWSLWQYGGGDVPGVSGGDSNRFNGTLADLRAWWAA